MDECQRRIRTTFDEHDYVIGEECWISRKEHGPKKTSKMVSLRQQYYERQKRTKLSESAEQED